MKQLIQIIAAAFVLFLLMFLVFGCSDNSALNPTDIDDPAPVVPSEPVDSDNPSDETETPEPPAEEPPAEETPTEEPPPEKPPAEEPPAEEPPPEEPPAEKPPTEEPPTEEPPAEETPTEEPPVEEPPAKEPPPEEPPAEEPPPELPISDPEPSAVLDSILVLLNERRIAGGHCIDNNNGLPGIVLPADPLERNSLLDVAANRHALDLLSMRENASHTGSDGSDVADRVRDAGYKWETVGENIAGYSGGGPSAKRAFQQWIDSFRHCVNMHLPNYEEVGLGYAYDPETEWHFYVQVFARHAPSY